MTRAERRWRAELKIRLREKRQDYMGAGGPTQIQRGHRLHKIDGAGACGNRGCWICAHERNEKYEAKKRERTEARRLEREAA